jgi:hypothetical protein
MPSSLTETTISEPFLRPSIVIALPGATLTLEQGNRYRWGTLEYDPDAVDQCQEIGKRRFDEGIRRSADSLHFELSRSW